LPDTLVSDRDWRFNSEFWAALHAVLGTSLIFGSPHLHNTNSARYRCADLQAWGNLLLPRRGLPLQHLGPARDGLFASRRRLVRDSLGLAVGSPTGGHLLALSGLLGGTPLSPFKWEYPLGVGVGHCSITGSLSGGPCFF
jgi:hypothetical protein